MSVFKDFDPNDALTLATCFDLNNNRCIYYQGGKDRIYVRHLIASLCILRCFDFFFDLNEPFMRVYSGEFAVEEKRVLYGKSKNDLVDYAVRGIIEMTVGGNLQIVDFEDVLKQYLLHGDDYELTALL